MQTRSTYYGFHFMSQKLEIFTGFLGAGDYVPTTCVSMLTSLCKE